jgi:hypothetical protein
MLTESLMKDEENIDTEMMNEHSAVREDFPVDVDS